MIFQTLPWLFESYPSQKNTVAKGSRFRLFEGTKFSILPLVYCESIPSLKVELYLESDFNDVFASLATKQYCERKAPDLQGSSAHSFKIIPSGVVLGGQQSKANEIVLSASFYYDSTVGVRLGTFCFPIRKHESSFYGYMT